MRIRMSKPKLIISTSNNDTCQPLTPTVRLSDPMHVCIGDCIWISFQSIDIARADEDKSALSVD